MLSSIFRKNTSRLFTNCSSLSKSTSSILSSSNLNQKRHFRSDLVGSTVHHWNHKDDLAYLRATEYVDPRPSTVKVAVTGGSGNISYALLFRLASGEMFGKNQRVQIHIYDIPQMYDKIRGIAMEINDCAFPTCEGILITDSLERAFNDVDVALMVGSKPRGPGQERNDLIRDNGKIFVEQAKALNKYARDCVKVTVVGNPANTNCLILANNCPDIPIQNFTAMTRLDHDRGLAQIAKKANCKLNDITNFCIWGNHSSTMFPDLTNCNINNRNAMDVLRDVNNNENMDEWYNNEFLPTVQKRGAAIIDARGSSSAASAANACLQHNRNWELGSDNGWVSMALCSNGEYNVTEGLMYSYPVVCENEQYKIVEGLNISSFQEEKMKITEDELLKERDIVADFLPN